MPRKAASSPEDAFLQTVLEHPDDDIPRLVFADWLEEQGNPRGAFIRLQCDRAKLTQHDPAWKTLLAQESALLKQFEAEWSKPVSRLVDAVHYRRGFIEHVSVSATKLLKNAERLFRLAPVCSVRLEHADSLPEIGASPWLARVVELDLSANPLGSKSLQALVRSEQCRNLRVLRLDRCVVGVPSAEVLANAPALASLQVLSAAGNAIGPDGIRLIARSPHLTQLCDLNVAENQLDSEGASALCETSARLTRLSIGNNRIGNDGVAALARSPQVAELRHLDLQNNAVGNLGVEAIIQSPHLTKLEHLNLYHNHVGARGVQLLTDSALLQNLTYVNLRSNEIDKPTLLTVPQRLQTTKMRELLF
jgi:uncharacterized protein (TIGR02996 family)